MFIPTHHEHLHSGINYIRNVRWQQNIRVTVGYLLLEGGNLNLQLVGREIFQKPATCKARRWADNIKMGLTEKDHNGWSWPRSYPIVEHSSTDKV
jgi:hypothetical protein